jgi:hypothetical protein
LFYLPTAKLRGNLIQLSKKRSLRMDAQATAGLLRFFQGLPDRRAANRSHPLGDVLGIAIMAVLCGCEGWAAVEAWGQGLLVLDDSDDCQRLGGFDCVVP